jgi:hypothetical protein
MSNFVNVKHVPSNPFKSENYENVPSDPFGIEVPSYPFKSENYERKKEEKEEEESIISLFEEIFLDNDDNMYEEREEEDIKRVSGYEYIYPKDIFEFVKEHEKVIYSLTKILMSNPSKHIITFHSDTNVKRKSFVILDKMNIIKDYNLCAKIKNNIILQFSTPQCLLEKNLLDKDNNLLYSCRNKQKNIRESRFEFIFNPCLVGYSKENTVKLNGKSDTQQGLKKKSLKFEYDKLVFLNNTIFIDHVYEWISNEIGISLYDIILSDNDITMLEKNLKLCLF